jgi:hypothetical protein
MVEAVVALVLGPVVVAAPASINKLARRKAKRSEKTSGNRFTFIGGWPLLVYPT